MLQSILAAWLYQLPVSASLEIPILSSDTLWAVSWVPDFFLVLPRMGMVLWPRQLASIPTRLLEFMSSFVRAHPCYLSPWPCTKLRSVMYDPSHITLGNWAAWIPKLRPPPFPWSVLPNEWPMPGTRQEFDYCINFLLQRLTNYLELGGFKKCKFIILHFGGQ